MNVYRLDEVGRPTADVICPHGKAVGFINKRDYSVPLEKETAKVGKADLRKWLRANANKHCFGHGKES